VHGGSRGRSAALWTRGWRTLLRLLGLPCARAPRLFSLFDVNHVGVGVGVLRVVYLLSSTYRGDVLPWDHPDELDLTETPRCAECFKRERQPGSYVPRCADVAFVVCCSVGTHHFTAPIAVGAGLARSIAAVAAASLLAELLHGFPRGLVLYFSGVAISAAAAVHGDVVCSQLSALCMLARQRSLEVRGPALRPRVGGLGAGFVVGSRLQRRRGFDVAPGSCTGRAPDR